MSQDNLKPFRQLKIALDAACPTQRFLDFKMLAKYIQKGKRKQNLYLCQGACRRVVACIYFSEELLLFYFHLLFHHLNSFVRPTPQIQPSCPIAPLPLIYILKAP